MPLGYWCPVLHGHLPYVRHPELPRFLEEDWFFEALTETYLPLVSVLDRLLDDGVDFRLTLSLSPPLLGMMTDRLLMGRYARHLDRLVDLACREIERTRREDRRYSALASTYARRLRDLRSLFHDTHASDLVGALRKHRDSGRLEILASAATHGLLPLLSDVPQAVEAQVRVGVAHHREVLGHDPTGFWLPECGYEPGLEGQLRKAGLSYSFLDAHGLTDARPRPSWGALAPVFSPGGVVFFGRDVESSRQVWSAKVGFPGHPDYREFYRDVGWDLPLDYLDDFLGDGRRRNLGIKYHRVTGQVDLGAKEIYDRRRALQRVAVHAEEFLSSRRRQIQDVAGAMSRPPIVVSAYDAELFGHWWFEGPEFLEALFRGLEAHAEVFVAVTPSEFLESFPDCEEAQPPMSTWGAGGYAGVWLDPANDWIYSHLRVAAERMVALARRHPEPDALTRRALNQAARELLLAQSSDWAFMMATGTTVEYAERRTRDHLGRFSLLHAALERGEIEEPELREIEARDNLFPSIDYRVYR